MSQPKAHHASSGRQVLISAIVAIAVVVGAYGWQRAHSAPEGPDNFTVALSDYHFTPDHMVWRVGERVTLTLVEASQAHPPKAHEFMIGQTPRTGKSVFGKTQEDGFETPFFSGVTIKILSGNDMKMLMPGDANLTGLSPKQVLAPGPMGEMEAMTGFMPVFGPNARLTFSFVVPDKPGDWTYGCFQQDGQHFLNGMKGTITILPKTA